MNDQKYCRELLEARTRGGVKLKLPRRIFIFLAIAVALGAVGDETLSIYGGMFLSIFGGALFMHFYQRRAASLGWPYMVRFLDWKKVEAAALSENEPSPLNTDREQGEGGNSE
jgi:hypothetical protein